MLTIKQDELLNVLIKAQTETIRTILELDCELQINKAVENHGGFCGALYSKFPSEQEFVKQKTFQSGGIVCKIRKSRFEELNK